LSLPTEEAARIALRTQQIVAFESGAPDTADPLAGSYFIESLTDEVEGNAWKLIEKIDAMGGAVAAVEGGFMQDEISRSAYQFQQNVERGEKIIVGVNKFTVEQEASIPGFKVDDQIREEQSMRLKALRERRDAQQVTNCLYNIEQAAVNGTNLMPPVIEAVEAYCTLGEISDVLRKLFGEHR
jgi:methylmalonyl-CoA mutase, N-terminal domain